MEDIVATMMVMRNWMLLVLVLLGVGFQGLSAQQDWSWVFGDSILMRFPGGEAPVVDPNVRTRYICEAGAAYSDALTTVTDTAAQSASCRERVFFVTASADGCSHQSFIAVNGDGIAEVLDLGDHAGRVTVRVWDVAGRLVYGLDDYKNDWDASTLANGLYVYRVEVGGDCPSSYIGKILVMR